MILIFSEKYKMFLMVCEQNILFNIWPRFTYTKYEKNETIARSPKKLFNFVQSRKKLFDLSRSVNK